MALKTDAVRDSSQIAMPFVFDMTFGTRDVFVRRYLIFVMRRSWMAGQTRGVLYGIHFVRKIEIQDSINWRPGRVAFGAVVFKHAVDGGDFAGFVDVVLASGSFIRQPCKAQHAQPERSPPRPTTEAVGPTVRLDLDPFGQFTA